MLGSWISAAMRSKIEDMKIKKKIFSSLDKITPPDCILLSNTSTLNIDEMASVVSPSRQALFAGWQRSLCEQRGTEYDRRRACVALCHWALCCTTAGAVLFPWRREHPW